jgi:UDP-N-acetylmuramyl pentapeptide phosphotransferase/UDP-N-acetylglucosamine-1-phosphate transferase
MQRVIVVGIVLVVAIVSLILSRRRGLLDRPGPDIVPARKPVATMQGIWLFASFVLAVILVFPSYVNNTMLWGLLSWGFLLVLVASWDEWHYLKGKRDVPAWLRLLVQLGAAALALYIGWIDMTEVVIQWTTIPLPFAIFAGAFFVWTLLCINAINWFDGVYGQASGVSSIWFLTIVLLIRVVVLPYYDDIQADTLVVLQFVYDMSMVLFLVSLVYTIIEYKPSGLVRDIGTMFLWFALAYLSVAGWAKIGTLVVALSLVIFDAIWVAIHRVFWMRKSMLQWDYTHLHYRLMWLGWNRGEVRAFVRGWSLIMTILMLLQGTDRISKIIIFVTMATVFFGVNAYLFWYKKIPCGLQIQKKKKEA